MSVISPMSLIPSKMALDVEIVNFNNKRLETDSNGSIIRLHMLENQGVAFQDTKSGLYLTKEPNNFEWESTFGTPNANQTFYLVKSNNPGFPFGIRSASGEYLGTDLVSFLKIAKWRWTSNLGNWESFSIQVKNVISL